MQGFDFGVLTDYWPDFVRGARATVSYSAVSLVLASLIGVAVALARLSHVTAMSGLARAYVDVVRGTPALVQIFFIYFGMPALGVNLSAPVAAVIALSINSGGYLSEIFRGGIVGIDAGQSEAGRSIGMSHGQTMRRIVLPQAALRVVPATAGEFTNLVKGTSLLSAISVSELTRVAQQIIGVTFRPVEAYVAIALIYLVLNTFISQGSIWLERRLRGAQGLA